MTATVLISQNSAQNGFKKCKVTLSISEMARDYAKANSLNMSSVLENALKSGSFNIKKSYSGAERLAVEISLSASKRGEKTFKTQRITCHIIDFAEESLHKTYQYN